MSEMRFSRLRWPEWLIGAAGLALIVILFAVPWYGFKGPYLQTYQAIGSGPTSYDGIQSLHVFGPLALLAGVGGLSTWLLQASRRAPALPVCCAVVTTSLAAVVTIGLFIRVLFAAPEISVVVGTKAGAYLGLALSAALFAGGYASIRREGIAPEDAPRDIEILSLSPRGPSA